MSDPEVEMLRRRIERERKARTEAEEIAERTTRELYETIERLRALVQSLATPVLRVSPRVLVMPLIGEVDQERARRFTAQLLDACRAHRARAVVIDLTGVPAVAVETAHTLVAAMTGARLLGARVIVTGISEHVAPSLAALGVLEPFDVAGDLSSGLALADG